MEKETSKLKRKLGHVFKMREEIYGDYISQSAQISYIFAYSIECFVLTKELELLLNQWKESLPLDLQYNDVDFINWKTQFNFDSNRIQYKAIDEISFGELKVDGHDEYGYLQDFSDRLFINKIKNYPTECLPYIKSEKRIEEKAKSLATIIPELLNEDIKKYIVDTMTICDMCLCLVLEEIGQLLELPNENILLSSFYKLMACYCDADIENFTINDNGIDVNIFGYYEQGLNVDIEDFKKWIIKIPKKDLKERIIEKLNSYRDDLLNSGFLEPQNRETQLSPFDAGCILETASDLEGVDPYKHLAKKQNEFSLSQLQDEDQIFDVDALAKYILFNRTEITFEQLCSLLRYMCMKDYIMAEYRDLFKKKQEAPIESKEPKPTYTLSEELKSKIEKKFIEALNQGWVNDQWNNEYKALYSAILSDSDFAKLFTDNQPRSSNNKERWNVKLFLNIIGKLKTGDNPVFNVGSKTACAHILDIQDGKYVDNWKYKEKSSNSVLTNNLEIKLETILKSLK